MKKLLCLVLALMMALACVSAFAEEKSDLQKAYDEEMHLARYITSRGAAYEFDTWNAYEHYWFQIAWSFDKSGKPIEAADEGIFNKYGEQVAAGGQEVVDKLRTLREALVQKVEDPESVCWYIWRDGTPEGMAQEDGVAEMDFSHKFDEAGFVPFLVPYMVEDQSQVKGNVIVVAGGGYNQRCHDYEGDASAIMLNQHGYNAFILQRRVEPFAQIDSSIDLQRAVRYLRYYAEEKGIGAIDNIATVGYSGGGSTVCFQMNTCYGDITPDSIYPTYVCDDIDKINSDYKVAGIFYGAPKDGYASENPNMPALFITVGTNDDGLWPQTIELIKQARELKWTMGAYIAAEAPHGFALTGVRAFTDQGTTAAAFAMDAFDEFLSIYFGLKPVHF